MLCPNCGSTAQPKIVATNFEEDGWTVKVIHHYKCSCGQDFTGTGYYENRDSYEEIKKK